MATSGLGGYDDMSAMLAEEFIPYVSDAVFQSNRVVRVLWDASRKANPGRYLAQPVLTAKNDTAQSFGQYDVLLSGPQSIYSVASMPWSWYQASVTIDYITARLVRGPNQRIDNTTVQIEDAIASLTDLIGNDTCSLTKGKSAPSGSPLVGIPEACDNGALVDVYGNIARLGTNSFGNWAGQVVPLASTGLGTPANDAPRSLMLRNYAACSVGDATPTHVFGNQQAVASYMFSMDSQVRVSPGDSANPYLGNPNMLGAQWVGDNHFPAIFNPNNASYFGYNMYYVNANHTSYWHFDKKGFDFVPWLDTPNVLQKTARYVTGFACLSDNPRLNGYLGAINDLNNL